MPKGDMMTMLARSAALAVLTLAAASLPAFAGPEQTPNEASPTPPQARFAFVPVEGGALKLDTRTGQVSLCAKDATGFTCTAVPDTRDAYEAEIARLQAEITALKQGAPAKAAPQPAPQAQSESSDLDKAFDYATQFYRRLRQMIDELTAPDKGETL